MFHLSFILLSPTPPGLSTCFFFSIFYLFNFFFLLLYIFSRLFLSSHVVLYPLFLSLYLACSLCLLSVSLSLSLQRCWAEVSPHYRGCCIVQAPAGNSQRSKEVTQLCLLAASYPCSSALNWAAICEPSSAVAALWFPHLLVPGSTGKWVNRE